MGKRKKRKKPPIENARIEAPSSPTLKQRLKSVWDVIGHVSRVKFVLYALTTLFTGLFFAERTTHRLSSDLKVSEAAISKTIARITKEIGSTFPDAPFEGYKINTFPAQTGIRHITGQTKTIFLEVLSDEMKGNVGLISPESDLEANRLREEFSHAFKEGGWNVIYSQSLPDEWETVTVHVGDGVEIVRGIVLHACWMVGIPALSTYHPDIIYNDLVVVSIGSQTEKFGEARNKIDFPRKYFLDLEGRPLRL